jgi:hypothetical protein
VSGEAALATALNASVANAPPERDSPPKKTQPRKKTSLRAV